MEEGGLFRDEKPETWVELYQPCLMEKLRLVQAGRDAEPWGGVKQTPVIRDLDGTLTSEIQGSKL